MFSTISYLCQNFLQLYRKDQYNNLSLIKKTISKPENIFLQAYLNLFDYLPFFKRRSDKLSYLRYWSNKSDSEIISAADKLYVDGEYLEVYKMLNRIQYNNNVDVRWRICRVLYKMSNSDNTPNHVKQNMILEAYGLICQTLDISQNNAEVGEFSVKYKSTL